MPALVLVYPPASRPALGAGLYVSGTFSGGGPGAGDIVRAWLRHPGVGNFVVGGSQLQDGVSGIWHVDFTNVSNSWAFQGDPLDLELRWDSGGIPVDDQTISGVYLNDSISGLYPAIALLAGGLTPDQQLELDAIRDAVIRAY